QNNHVSYEWFEYPDGHSVIIENGKYFLTPTETKILKFCDDIRTISELEKNFSNLSKKYLKKIVKTLYESGFLFFDNHLLLSILNARKIKKL
ncbi:MAG: hypothetical protein J7K95_04370, partial [Thermoplasmata archaeon]|nr:hypothetical protein [Thermoplasmata archaeon]